MNQKLSLDTKLSDCDELALHTVNMLLGGNVTTLRDLASQNKNDFLRSFHVGKSALNQLDELLQANGLDWGMKLPG
jgi:hypothetical protein